MRIALHNHRAIDQVGQQHRRDIGIELKQIAFGYSQIRPKYFTQIG